MAVPAPSGMTILAQRAPANDTLEVIYIVPLSDNNRKAFCVLVRGANRTAVARWMSVAYAPLGAADATSQYMCFEAPIAANEEHDCVFGISTSPGAFLSPGDIIRVRCDQGVSFQLYGAY